MNSGRVLRSRSVRFTLIALPLIVLTACGGSAPPVENSLSVFLMRSDVEVGEARVPIVVTLADADGTRLDDRLTDLTFSYRHGADESFRTITGVTWRAWPVRGGAYTSVVEFDRPGFWEFQVSYRDGKNTNLGSGFLAVEQDSAAPSVGDKAPITVTRTANTVDEVRQISSAFDPDPRFHQISLDEALMNGRPTAVLFSTPAFCVTQTCGPQLETLGDLMDVHGDRMDFIHVEIFENIREMLDSGNSEIGETARAVEDWGLITEPWTFFMDNDGTIRARFEQFATFDELSQAADLVLAAK